MYAMDALKIAAEKSGKSLYAISIGIGKSRQYVNSVITRGSTPQCNTMSRMLEVCGYQLVAISKDRVTSDMLVIDD